MNYYDHWNPQKEHLSQWHEWSGKPCLITEFYVKGMDSGMANASGAGWVVKTQADRGAFYQNFALALLESGTCLGWHWFKYMDNDPELALRALRPAARRDGGIQSPALSHRSATGGHAGQVSREDPPAARIVAQHLLQTPQEKLTTGLAHSSEPLNSRAARAWSGNPAPKPAVAAAGKIG
jgi:hypothetical protein